jgi:hypothetical protein
MRVTGAGLALVYFLFLANPAICVAELSNAERWPGLIGQLFGKDK